MSDKGILQTAVDKTQEIAHDVKEKTKKTFERVAGITPEQKEEEIGTAPLGYGGVVEQEPPPERVLKQATYSSTKRDDIGDNMRDAVLTANTHD